MLENVPGCNWELFGRLWTWRYSESDGWDWHTSCESASLTLVDYWPPKEAVSFWQNLGAFRCGIMIVSSTPSLLWCRHGPGPVPLQLKLLPKYFAVAAPHSPHQRRYLRTAEDQLTITAIESGQWLSSTPFTVASFGSRGNKNYRTHPLEFLVWWDTTTSSLHVDPIGREMWRRTVCQVLTIVVRDRELYVRLLLVFLSVEIFKFKIHLGISGRIMVTARGRIDPPFMMGHSGWCNQFRDDLLFLAYRVKLLALRIVYDTMHALPTWRVSSSPVLSSILYICTFPASPASPATDSFSFSSCGPWQSSSCPFFPESPEISPLSHLMLQGPHPERRPYMICPGPLGMQENTYYSEFIVCPDAARREGDPHAPARDGAEVGEENPRRASKEAKWNRRPTVIRAGSNSWYVRLVASPRCSSIKKIRIEGFSTSVDHFLHGSFAPWIIQSMEDATLLWGTDESEHDDLDCRMA